MSGISPSSCLMEQKNRHAIYWMRHKEESFALVQAGAREAGFEFPYLHDAEQIVGKAFGAEHTPQAFVIWKENGTGVVKYAGAIDDNGEEPEKAKPSVANTIDDLLAAKPAHEAEMESFGCRIFFIENDCRVLAQLD